MITQTLRNLARRPVFAGTIVGTLTIAIGATVAGFAFIDAVFLTRLPVRDQNALVVLEATNPGVSTGFWGIPLDARAQLMRGGAFTDATGFMAWTYPFAARDGDHVIHLVRSAVSGNFFNVLGARAEVGRLLRPEDDVQGAPNVVVLSDHLWRHELNADPTIVGRVLYFARVPHRVIGVAPPELVYPSGVDAWTAAAPEYFSRFGESVDSMASRRHLIEYLLTECIVLAVAGGALGLCLAVLLIRLAIAFAPPGLPMIAGAHVNPTVVAFAFALTVLSALASGLAPTLRGAS